MNFEKGGTCWSCSRSLNALEYGRQDSCPGCRRSTRACKNCEHYDTAYNNSCRENQADRVVDKEAGNFCDYFRPITHGASSGPKKEDLFAAADALFKKSR